MNTMNLIYVIVLSIMMLVIPTVGIYELTLDTIKYRKEKMNNEIRRNRRDQLIKELRAGTFSKDEAKSKLRELNDLMRPDFYVKFDAKMTKNHVGFYQLTTLVTDGYSWI